MNDGTAGSMICSIPFVALAVGLTAAPLFMLAIALGRERLNERLPLRLRPSHMGEAPAHPRSHGRRRRASKTIRNHSPSGEWTDPLRAERGLRRN